MRSTWYGELVLWILLYCRLPTVYCTGYSVRIPGAPKYFSMHSRRAFKFSTPGVFRVKIPVTVTSPEVRGQGQTLALGWSL